MGFDLLQIALDFLAEYGLLAVFILLVLDGAMLMPVLPGEAVMIMAVAQYAETVGDLVLLVVIATAAAMVGALALYGVARAGGRPLAERHPKLFMMNPRRRMKLERAFERPLGQTLVLFLRVIPLTRVLVSIPAGLAKMKLVRYIVLSTIGMAIFHAGFMWLAFEFRQPGSGVAAQATQLQDAYASPAWDYMQANEVITGLGILVLGAVISFRASRQVLKDPEYATGSMIGWLAARILYWGGVVLAATMWAEPGVVYQLAEAGGLDVLQVAADVGYSPMAVVLTAAAVMFVMGLILISMQKAAKRRRKRFQRRKEREQKRKEQREKQQERDEAQGGPVEFTKGEQPEERGD